MTGLVVGLTVAVALLAILVVGLLRGHAEVLRALHQMGVELDPSGNGAAGPVGLPDPQVRGGARPTPARPDSTDVIDLAGETPTGDAVSVAVAGVRHDTLVAFLTSGCATCQAFWNALRAGVPDVPGGARLVVVTRGSEAESPGAIASLAGNLPVVMSSEAWEHYDIPYAPYFVYISGPASRVMGEGVAAGWEEVRVLVSNAVADGTTSPASSPSVRATAAETHAAAESAAAGRTAAAAGTATAAGIATRRGWHERSAADQRRDADVDQRLQEAGIEPGDPRLYPTSLHADGDLYEAGGMPEGGGLQADGDLYEDGASL